MARLSLSRRIVAGAFASVVALGLQLPSSGADAVAAGASRGGQDAAKLVEQALAAGLAGNSAQRVALLANAIKADPDYAPAQWQSGQVKFQGKWQDPSDVGSLVAYDRRWQEYQELRQSASTLADQVALAQWCMREGLAHEERYHWAIVLLSDPSNEQARKRLDLREFNGRLYSSKEVAQYQQQRKQAEADLRRFRPELLELCRQARSQSKSLRGMALTRIGKVSDIAAMAALEEAVERNSRKAPDELTEDLHLAYVSALGNMREHEATLRLLNHAVFSSFPEVRRLAAQMLKPRPVTDYVPLLMAALKSPVEVEFDVVTAPDGTVRMLETLKQSGPESDVAHIRSTNFEVAGTFGRDVTKEDPSAILGAHLSTAASQAGSTQAEVDAMNKATAERNVRIEEVMKIAAGTDYGSDPELWWKAWSAENELRYDEPEPVYTSYEEDTRTYYYEQAKAYPMSYGDMRGMPSSVSITAGPLPSSGSASAPLVRPLGGVECFAPGTPVWTQAGPMPIERIAVGDMVLSQNPDTGELDYRPVVQTTGGGEVRVKRLTFGDETITATLGHRFWIDGHGWEMVKAFKPSTNLHAMGGSLQLKSVDDVEPIACHNLVVDDFHTYFVGKSRLLVHDKSCPRPTLSVSPGYRGAPVATQTSVGSLLSGQRPLSVSSASHKP